MKQNFKKIGKSGAFLLALLLCFQCKAQLITTVCQTYYFNGSFDIQYNADAKPFDNFFGNLTIQCWVKRDSSSMVGQQTIMSCNNTGTGLGSYDLILLAVNNDILTGRLGNITLNTPFPTDTNWHHVKLVKDSLHTKTCLFIDGTLRKDTSSINTGLLKTSTYFGDNTLSIGSQLEHLSTSTNNWKGNLTEFLISTTADTSNFTPDCDYLDPLGVYTFCGFLNDVISSYLIVGTGTGSHVSVLGTLTSTSPCMPVLDYTFDTSHNSCGIDTIGITAHNSNKYARFFGGWGSSGLLTDTFTSNVTTDTGAYWFSLNCLVDSFHLSICDTSLSLSSKNILKSSDINIYPIPADGYVNINCDGFISVEVIDYTGRILSYSGEKTLRLKDVPNGNYVLKIKSMDGYVVKQISVVH